MFKLFKLEVQVFNLRLFFTIVAKTEEEAILAVKIMFPEAREITPLFELSVESAPVLHHFRNQFQKQPQS
jgi:hypothetical protein